MQRKRLRFLIGVMNDKDRLRLVCCFKAQLTYFSSDCMYVITCYYIFLVGIPIGYRTRCMGTVMALLMKWKLWWNWIIYLNAVKIIWNVKIKIYGWFTWSDEDLRRLPQELSDYSRLWRTQPYSRMLTKTLPNVGCDWRPFVENQWPRQIIWATAYDLFVKWNDFRYGTENIFKLQK